MTAPAPVPAEDQPTHTHPWYDSQLEQWTKVRDLLGGTKAVRAKGQLYLPKHAAERDEDYAIRLKLGVLYNGFKRTLGAMVGLVMQRDVTLAEDASAEIVAHWETIDNMGNHGTVFASQLLREGLATNWAGVLVDTPTVMEIGRPLTKAEEQAQGIRPYWRLYRAEDIRDWQYTTYQGQEVLSLLVLREVYTRRKGRFETEEVTDYRVFTWNGPGDITWELWREGGQGTARTASLIAGPASLKGPQRIPFAFFCPNKPKEPPALIDLADLNITHYRTDTDRRHLMRLGCLPIPVRVGYNAGTNEPVKPFGTNVLQDVPKDGNMFWMEITGAAFEVTGKDLQMIEARMGSMGLAFLSPDTRGVETAEAKRIDSTAQNATLADAARALQDTLEQLMLYHAEYIKQPPPSVQVNTEFERVMMAPEMINTLSGLELKGQLSLETLLAVLRNGHALGDDVDLEQELARIMATRRSPDDGGEPNNADDEDGDDDTGDGSSSQGRNANA